MQKFLEIAKHADVNETRDSITSWKLSSLDLGLWELSVLFSAKIHAFFNKQHLFSTQPQCCLTFSWIELQMLLKCCLIHKSIIILRDIETPFIFILFVFMTILRSVFVVSTWSVFHFHLHFHDDYSYNFMNADIDFRWSMPYYSWMIMGMKNVNFCYFHIAKVQPQIVG